MLSMDSALREEAASRASPERLRERFQSLLEDLHEPA
jgi:hypothetical protein